MAENIPETVATQINDGLPFEIDDTAHMSEVQKGVTLSKVIAEHIAGKLDELYPEDNSDRAKKMYLALRGVEITLPSLLHSMHDSTERVR